MIPCWAVTAAFWRRQSSRLAISGANEYLSMTNAPPVCYDPPPWAQVIAARALIIALRLPAASTRPQRSKRWMQKPFNFANALCIFWRLMQCPKEPRRAAHADSFCFCCRASGMAGALSSRLRVVSLLSSVTETIVALGLEDSLIGRSHECDYPASVMKLPMCSKPTIDIQASGLEIDRQVSPIAPWISRSRPSSPQATPCCKPLLWQVRSRVQQALSVYEVDHDALSRLKPDLIITQTQCEVCAVSLTDVERSVARMTGGDVRVVSVHPGDLQVRGLASAGERSA
jgi:hypothetical protein